MNDLPLWKFEDRVEASPTKDPALAFSGQKATQVEEADPQVDLKLDSVGPALVGENFMLPVTITSKGHSIYSGELKINLVDTRGGGLLSPRDTEASSTDNLHVELLGLSGLESEDESQSSSDNIRKIQHSFGLISVPFLSVGDTWSCSLEIRWHRPKPIMLYVSLGYSPNDGAPKVHVHKSLQIEGKTPLGISNRFMLPFRRDPLLLSKIKPVPDTDQLPLLPANETSILIVSAKNCAEVPLRLLSLSIEPDDDDVAKSNRCTIQHGEEDFTDPAFIVPGGEFKKVFSVIPDMNTTSKLKMGSVCLKWRRDFGSSRPTSSEVLTKQRLPDVQVESPPLAVSLECPPHAILGEPFTYYVRIHNQTKLLQEVKFSLADSQSFVLSGSHSDTVFVLPKSEHVLGYKLVPLASGSLHLPKVTLTSLRYSAGFQPSISASTIFVFPSKPHFNPTDAAMRLKSVTTEQIPA